MPCGAWTSNSNCRSFLTQASKSWRTLCSWRSLISGSSCGCQYRLHLTTCSWGQFLSVAATFGPPTNSTGRDPATSTARDPGSSPCELLQSPVPVDAVQQYARRLICFGHASERPPEEELELAQILAVHPELVGYLFELPAVIYGQHAQLPGVVAGRRAVEVVEPLVVLQTPEPARPWQVVLELLARRHGRRAPVPGDDDSAAGVPEAQALLQGLLAQPAAQEATHERVPGSHAVEHLHGEAGDTDAVLDGVRDLSGEDYGSHRADLEHDGPTGEPADAPERLDGIRRAAGDPDLLLRADNEVAARQRGAVDLRYLLAGDEHLAALFVRGHTPEHGPVIQVEHHPGPGLLRGLDRLEGGRPGPGP